MVAEAEGACLLLAEFVPERGRLAHFAVRQRTQFWPAQSREIFLSPAICGVLILNFCMVSLCVAELRGVNMRSLRGQFKTGFDSAEAERNFHSYVQQLRVQILTFHDGVMATIAAGLLGFTAWVVTTPLQTNDPMVVLRNNLNSPLFGDNGADWAIMNSMAFYLAITVVAYFLRRIGFLLIDDRLQDRAEKSQTGIGKFSYGPVANSLWWTSDGMMFFAYLAFIFGCILGATHYVPYFAGP
jgi:hypothetical protein